MSISLRIVVRFFFSLLCTPDSPTPPVRGHTGSFSGLCAEQIMLFGGGEQT